MFSMTREPISPTPRSTSSTSSIADISSLSIFSMAPPLTKPPLISWERSSCATSSFLWRTASRTSYPARTEQKYHPFFVYVDEAHRYVTDDVEGLLTQARKFGIGVTLAHQYLAQLGKPGEKIYEAVRNSTETKVVFRVKSPEEAQALAYDVLPLSLELPVQASIRPTQIGFTIGKLCKRKLRRARRRGRKRSRSCSRSDQSRPHRDADVDELRKSRVGKCLAVAAAPPLWLGFLRRRGQYHRIDGEHDVLIRSEHADVSSRQSPLGMSIGSADSTSQSLISSKNFQSAESLSRFQGLSETKGRTNAEATGIAASQALTTSRGKTLGKNKTRGEHQKPRLRGCAHAVL